MEPVTHTPTTVKGIEVLYFEDAEVTKTKGDQKSFATFGPLSVLHFKDYNRFILQINGWRYPLLRRLSITSSGNSYILPAMNGYSYELKINEKPGQALTNFNELLGSIRGLEKSPEDKLVRPPVHPKETGPKEVITQTINQIIHKVQNKTASLKTGTKNLTSKKKRVNLKDIKNKDFKKEAHSRIKKDFFMSSEKVSSEFLKRRKHNFNLVEPRDMETLRKTSGYDAAVMHLPKEEIEETILLGKDISPIDSTLSKPEEKKGFMESLKEGFQNMKDSLKRGDSRNAAPEVQAEKMPVSAEGMTHYQG